MPRRGAGGRFVKSSRVRRAARRTYSVGRRMGGRFARYTARISRPSHRGLLGGSAKEQWGTKIIAAEEVAAAGMLPFVSPTGTQNGSVAGEIAYAIRTGDTNGFTVAAESFPGQVQSQALPQLTLAVQAGFVRLIGRILGV